MAYRVTSINENQDQEHQDDIEDDGESSTYVTEGYDDSNEEGCG